MELNELFLEKMDYDFIKRELIVNLQDINKNNVILKFINVNDIFYFNNDREKVGNDEKINFIDCNSVLKVHEKINVSFEDSPSFNVQTKEVKTNTTKKSIVFNYMLDNDIHGLDYPLYVSASKVLLNDKEINLSEPKKISKR